MTKQTGINEKHTDLAVLSRLEFELKQIWHKANASQGETKARFLDQYKQTHGIYRRTKMRLIK